MKKSICFILSILLLLSFAGCGDETVSSKKITSIKDKYTYEPLPNNKTDKKEPVSPAPVTPTEPELPEDITGTYNGKMVTLSICGIVDVIPERSNAYFVNGYSSILDSNQPDEDAEYNKLGDTSTAWSIVDTSGNIIGLFGADEITPFDKNGIAVARSYEYIDDAETESIDVYCFMNTKCEIIKKATKADYKKYEELRPDFITKEYTYYKTSQNGQYKIIDIEGEEELDETPIINPEKIKIKNQNEELLLELDTKFYKAKFITDNLIVAYQHMGNTDFNRYLYNIDGTLLSNEPFEYIGNCENNIVPFVQNNKLGLMSQNGEVIIPATLKVRLSPFYGDAIVFNEGHMIV